MRTRIAVHWLTLGFALACLAGCGPKRDTVRPQLIEHDVKTYVPVPGRYTHLLQAPAPPARRCTDKAGEPTVCALDGLAQIPLWRGVFQRCNADRATVGRIRDAPVPAASSGGAHGR